MASNEQAGDVRDSGRDSVENIGRLAIEWIRLKDIAKEAKKKRREVFAEYGACNGRDIEDDFLPGRSPCRFEFPKNPEKWCEICEARQPSHLAYRLAANKQSAALTRLRNAVRRATPTTEAKA